MTKPNGKTLTLRLDEEDAAAVERLMRQVHHGTAAGALRHAARHWGDQRERIRTLTDERTALAAEVATLKDVLARIMAARIEERRALDDAADLLPV